MTSINVVQFIQAHNRISVKYLTMFRRLLATPIHPQLTSWNTWTLYIFKTFTINLGERIKLMDMYLMDACSFKLAIHFYMVSLMTEQRCIMGTKKILQHHYDTVIRLTKRNAAGKFM